MTPAENLKEHLGTELRKKRRENTYDSTLKLTENHNVKILLYCVSTRSEAGTGRIPKTR
jgi:hypothetical protein